MSHSGAAARETHERPFQHHGIGRGGLRGTWAYATDTANILEQMQQDRINCVKCRGSQQDRVDCVNCRGSQHNRVDCVNWQPRLKGRLDFTDRTY